MAARNLRDRPRSRRHMTVTAFVAAWVVACAAVLAFAYRRVIRAAWSEPVLRAPVLILESDDWGYGPVEQAEALRRVGDLLAGYRDGTGRHPVMTLGVVLAGPDTAAMRSEGGERYRRLTLTDDPLVPVRDAMLGGASRGVFALQLHGREHFWPECLMRAARDRPESARWLGASRRAPDRGTAAGTAKPLDGRRGAAFAAASRRRRPRGGGGRSPCLRRCLRQGTRGGGSADVRVDPRRRGRVGASRRPRDRDARAP